MNVDPVRAPRANTSQARGRLVQTGVSLGAAMAVAMSWSANHSIGWAILHALCGWFYVIAYALGFVDQWVP